MAHRPTGADRPRRRRASSTAPLRTEARLTRTGPDGDVSMGLAGSWAAGAVLVDGDEPARFDQVTTRARRHLHGRPTRPAARPPHDGWRWEPFAVDGSDVEAARQQLQRLMRDAEADIADALSTEGWLTDITGPADAVRLYDVVELARGRRRPDHQRPRGTADMPTTYRVVLDTETRPREAAVALDHLPAIQVDAPNVDIAARLALAHHIDSRPIPPPAGTSFGLLVITRRRPTTRTCLTTTSPTSPRYTTSTSSTGPTQPPRTDPPVARDVRASTSSSRCRSPAARQRIVSPPPPSRPASSASVSTRPA